MAQEKERSMSLELGNAIDGSTTKQKQKGGDGFTNYLVCALNLTVVVHPWADSVA